MSVVGTPPTAPPVSALEERIQRLSDRSANVFRRYVENPDESALLEAYELGREALGEGLGVLEVSRLVSSVITSIEELPGAAERAAAGRAVDTFLVELLSPFEMAHRGFREANAVLRRLNDMLEAQTRRIAAALHDEASDLLTPLHLAVADAVGKAPQPLATDLREIRGLLNRMEDRLRSLAHELRPPALDQFGLVAALDLLARATTLRHGLEVDVRTSIDTPMPATVDATLYRVVQEALNNVAKHAHASRVEIEILRGRSVVTCLVRDDGTGFEIAEAQDAGLGLAGMRERVAGLGGTVHVGPGVQGQGTAVQVQLPLES